MRRLVYLLLTIGLSTLIAACGGGGGGGGHTTASGSGGSSGSGGTSTPTGDNVQPITVNGGPVINGVSEGVPNIAYTTITICVPGTTQCQTLNNVLIDTGSVGLRVLASALGNLSLPQQSLPSQPSHSLAECISFLDGAYVWGPVRIADIKIGGKTASSTRIHVIADSAFGAPPQACVDHVTAATPYEVSTIQDLGGTAILGIGQWVEDCGQNCAVNAQNDVYYDCTTSTPTNCVETAADTSSQVQNPVAKFSSDNNGVIIQLPTVGSSGAASVDGWLIFGINTRDNNAIGSAKIFTVDSNGFLDTNYKGVDYAAFVDSGSNSLYFPDATITKCDPSDQNSFFCPASTLNLSATMEGVNKMNLLISFNVANASLFNISFNAFNNLAANASNYFDWGTPFFFGRKVYTSFETNPEGPYIAF